MRNFNFPYFSRSIPEFWRRWHISLTTWFRDYIYFPLGGSRCDKWKVIRNVYIVWAVSGLWHGANWTFVCWGLFHGTLLAIYNLLGISTKYKDVVAQGHLFPSLKELFQMLLTFCLAVIGWVIFRAETMTDAINYLASLFSPSLFDIAGSIGTLRSLDLKIIVSSLALLLVCEWIQRDKQHALQFSNNGIIARNAWLRFAIYLILIMLTLSLAGTQSEFIYFQF